MSGGKGPEMMPDDDIRQAEDPGRITSRGQLRIYNCIFHEMIPRILTQSTRSTIAQEPACCIDCRGRLEINKLLQEFQQFFREQSEVWLKWCTYREAGPQLLLQTFLQQIMNAGGQITREYGPG